MTSSPTTVTSSSMNATILAEAKARYVTGLTATPYRRGRPPADRSDAVWSGAVRGHAEGRDRSTSFRAQARLSLYRFPGGAPRPERGHSGAVCSVGVRPAAKRTHPERRDWRLSKNPARRSCSRSVETISSTSARACEASLATWWCCRGGATAKTRRDVMARLAAIPADEERLLLATGRYIGEGFDDARLDTLFLAMPVSWKGTLVQYTGRLHRMSPGKIEVRIYDYVDREVPLLARMFEKRMRGYRAIGYRSSPAPAVSVAPSDPTMVEYDEDFVSDFDSSTFQHDAIQAPRREEQRERSAAAERSPSRSTRSSKTEALVDGLRVLDPDRGEPSAPPSTERTRRQWGREVQAASIAGFGVSEPKEIATRSCGGLWQSLREVGEQ